MTESNKVTYIVNYSFNRLLQWSFPRLVVAAKNREVAKLSNSFGSLIK